MQSLKLTTELLTPLQGLSTLDVLILGSKESEEGLEAVCQLTGLRCLELWTSQTTPGLLLQLTQLQQLTRLEVVDGTDNLSGEFVSQVGDGVYSVMV